MTARWQTVLKSILLLGVFINAYPDKISAAEPPSPAASVSIVHIPPKAESLPLPAKMLTLEVKLSGTNRTNRKLRALVVRDGRLIDVALGNAQRNERDEPIYKLAIYSPLAELSYQFILYNPDGSVTGSERYVLRRTCLPNIELTDTTVPTDAKNRDLIETLVRQSKGLDRDLESYEKVYALLEELKGLIKG